MRFRLTSEWIAEKLGLDSKDIALFIEANREEYFKMPREERVAIADSVEYVHLRIGKILFGPKNIVAGDRIIADAGYASREFKNWAGKSGGD